MLSRALSRRLIALCVVAFAAVTAAVGVRQGAPLRFLVLDTIFGLTFVFAGLAAWERRPQVPYGPLLVAAGALWWVGSYAPSGLEPYALIGFSFERYYDIILAFIVLTFPGVNLSPAGRTVMSVLVLGFVFRSVTRLVVSDIGLFESLNVFTSWVIVLSSLGVVVLAVNRFRHSGPAARRILTPVVIAGVVAALVAVWDALDLILFIETGDGLVRLDEPWREVVSWAVIAAVSLVPIGYLVGVLRHRIRRGPLTSLALELDRRTDVIDLEQAIRQAFGDGSTELLVWNQESDTWLDASRNPVSLPEEDETRAVTIIELGQAPGAAIVHDPTLHEDPGLLSAVAALLRLALDNERLAAEVRQQLEAVRASRARLVEAAAAERRRIERDLHDGAQQHLIAVALALQESREEARRHAPNATFVTKLDDTADELLAAIEGLRELARGIHPVVLTEDGLGVAVASLARRANVPVDVEVDVDNRLSTAIETTAYYVVAEGLTNLTRHSNAQRASVRIAKRNGHLEVEVSDDGRGGADPSHGSGLSGLTDRLDAVLGTLQIDSPPLGGTRLRAKIPCE